MRIILTSHGEFCQGLLQTLSMFVSTEGVIAISLDESGVEEYEKKLNEALNTEDEYLILTDIAGGSPYQTAVKYKLEHNKTIEILSGLNLPMAVEAVIGKELHTPSQLAEKCIATGTESIGKFELQTDINEDDE